MNIVLVKSVIKVSEVEPGWFDNLIMILRALLLEELGAWK